jgi:hypothetical protein
MRPTTTNRRAGDAAARKISLETRSSPTTIAIDNSTVPARVDIVVASDEAPQ